VTRRALALAAAALLLAACSGDDDAEEAAPPPPPATSAPAETGGADVAPDDGRADPAPGRVLVSFVRAAGRGDARAMWGLLSEPTRASIGPTFDDFRTDAAIEFQRGLGTLAPSAEVVLSRTLPDWSVAAVAGERVAAGKREHFAYGAALIDEGGGLKLELGGVVVSGHRPEPLDEVDDASPRVAANVGAGGDLTDVRMWLDAKPFPARRGADDTPFTATLRGEPARPLAAGRHIVVVFAATEETATATAWSFSVVRR
jgi:hypothetical protein